MSSTPKLLIGSLVGLNVALIGLLLFREQSVVPAQADAISVTRTEPIAPVAPPPAVAMVESNGGTSFAPAAPVATEVAPAVVSVEVAPEPAVESARPAVAVKPPAERPAAPRPAPAQPASLPQPVAQVASIEYPRDLPVVDAKEIEPSIAEVRPDVAPAPEPKPITVTVGAGTSVPVLLSTGLNSRHLRPGASFEATLGEDIVADGQRLARAGDLVTGQVTDIRESGRVKGLEQLSMTLTEITLAGKRFPIEASVVTITARDDKQRDAKVVGGAAAVGAILGAIADGKKGAAKGAAAGAAAGGGVVLGTRGRAVELASGAELNFTLSKSVRVILPPRSSPDPAADEPDAQPAPDAAAPGVARR